MANGVEKNAQVLTEQLKRFRRECRVIDNEVQAAWDAGDAREYFHKCSAYGPENFEIMYRWWGYLTWIIWFPPVLVFKTIQMLVRR